MNNRKPNKWVEATEEMKSLNHYNKEAITYIAKKYSIEPDALAKWFIFTNE